MLTATIGVDGLLKRDVGRSIGCHNRSRGFLRDMGLHRLRRAIVPAVIKRTALFLLKSPARIVHGSAAMFMGDVVPFDRAGVWGWSDHGPHYIIKIEHNKNICRVGLAGLVAQVVI